MAEIKKCPFCGSGVAKIKVGSPFMWEHAIVCADCGASTKLMGGITPSIARDRAIKAWNNRVTEADIRNKVISDFLKVLERNKHLEKWTNYYDEEECDWVISIDKTRGLAAQLKEG